MCHQVPDPLYQFAFVHQASGAFDEKCLRHLGSKGYAPWADGAFPPPPMGELLVVNMLP